MLTPLDHLIKINLKCFLLLLNIYSKFSKNFFCQILLLLQKYNCLNIFLIRVDYYLLNYLHLIGLNNNLFYLYNCFLLL